MEWEGVSQKDPFLRNRAELKRDRQEDRADPFRNAYYPDQVTSAVLILLFAAPH
jgi:hypothetical protein